MKRKKQLHGEPSPTSLGIRWKQIQPPWFKALHTVFDRTKREIDPALTWEEFAIKLGVTDETLRRWNSPNVFIETPPRGLLEICHRAKQATSVPTAHGLPQQDWQEIAPELVHRYISGEDIAPSKVLPHWFALFRQSSTATPAVYESTKSIPGQRQAAGLIRAGGLPLGFRELVPAPATVEVSYRDQIFVPSVNPSLVIKWLYEVQEHAFHQGRAPYFRPLARLAGFKVEKGAVVLECEKTWYTLFMATNLNEACLQLQEDMSPENPFRIPNVSLANPLNVIALIVTKDNVAFIPQRTTRVDEGQSQWQASVGGVVAFGEPVLSAVMREIREEWGIGYRDPNEVTNIRCLSFGINQRIGEPDLLFLVRTKLSSNDDLLGVP